MATPIIYYWCDMLSCGHERIVETSVPTDRNLPWEDDYTGRIGSPTACYMCDPRNVDVIVMTTRRIAAPIEPT